MNCFEWQNRSSDYLDGALSSRFSQEADEHLKTCKTCEERLKRYQTILSTISSQLKTPLPAGIKAAPLAATLPPMETAKIAFSSWEQIPWYFRTLLEAAGICIAVSLGIAVAPRVRSIYEKNLEKGLIDFKESFKVNENLAEGIDPQVPLAHIQSSQVDLTDTETEELNGEADSDDTDENVSVGKSQLWRFTLKTVSPDELRPQVYQALIQQNVAPKTPGIAGILVPGGVEFDLILPQSTVNNIKKSLQKLVPDDESFSWYRVKSRRKLPEGKSQVVIWLSQPTKIQ